MGKAMREIPEEDFLTKQGTIPKKRNDIDNYIKCFIDAVFKNFEDLDDSYILELVALKVRSKSGGYNARMSLEVSPLD